MNIRKARPDDAPAFVAIKEQLPLTLCDGSQSKGGFLLGTDAVTYASYIGSSWCLVAETGGKVVGFGIIFPDAVLRSSDIWHRRATARWTVDLNEYEPHTLCYFEQLAFLNGYRRTAIALAYHLTMLAYAQGSEYLFTTTVRQPVLNLAAIPFINAAGGIKAGSIDEEYPVVGRILSDIYVVSAAVCSRNAAAHPLFPFFHASKALLA